MGLSLLPHYVRVIANLTRRNISVNKSVAKLVMIHNNFEKFRHTTNLLNSTT
jgi:hypothetical protein